LVHDFFFAFAPLPEAPFCLAIWALLAADLAASLPLTYYFFAYIKLNKVKHHCSMSSLLTRRLNKIKERFYFQGERNALYLPF